MLIGCVGLAGGSHQVDLLQPNYNSCSDALLVQKTLFLSQAPIPSSFSFTSLSLDISGADLLNERGFTYA